MVPAAFCHQAIDADPFESSGLELCSKLNVVYQVNDERDVTAAPLQAGIESFDEIVR